MGREIRRVPANWDHPKRIVERNDKFIEEYRPMFDSFTFDEAVKEFKKEVKNWIKGHEKWQQGIYWCGYKKTEMPKEEKLKDLLEYVESERAKYGFGPSYRSLEKERYRRGICSWADLHGEPPRYPDPDDYMPQGEWWQLFESVSEGTPLSPPFATAGELVEWLSTNPDYWGTQWSREGAEGIVKDGFAMSMIVTNGKIYQPHEQHLIDVK